MSRWFLWASKFVDCDLLFNLEWERLIDITMTQKHFFENHLQLAQLIVFTSYLWMKWTIRYVCYFRNLQQQQQKTPKPIQRWINSIAAWMLNKPERKELELLLRWASVWFSYAVLSTFCWFRPFRNIEKRERDRENNTANTKSIECHIHKQWNRIQKERGILRSMCCDVISVFLIFFRFFQLPFWSRERNIQPVFGEPFCASLSLLFRCLNILESKWKTMYVLCSHK